MNSRTTTLFVAGAVLAALLAGCGKKDEGKSGGSGDSIGVSECDDYLKTVEACSGKASPEGKAAMEIALKANREAWKDASKNPATKEALSPGCKAALEAFIAANPSCK